MLQINIEDSQAKIKTKKMACVECRQQKSKCDAQERAPEPCTRCKNRNLKCCLKSDYKRTYKRARNAQLENAYSELRTSINDLLSSLKNGNTSNNSAMETAKILNEDVLRKLNYLLSSEDIDERQTLHSSNSAIKSDDVHHLPSGNHNDIVNSNQNGSQKGISVKNTSIQEQNTELLNQTALTSQPKNIVPTLTDRILHCEPKSVQSTYLSSEKIRELYIEFVRYYHPILPLIDTIRGPERIYRLCPPLFWVIMLTALRRYSDPVSRSLLMDLSPTVKNIFEALTISPITRYAPSEFDDPIYNASSVYTVQAFILFSMWPPLTSSLSADSSWNTIGIAIHQAVRIGLHSPGHANDFSNSAKTDDSKQILLNTEQLRTWICCNIVSQTISTVFGYPDFTSYDNKLLSFIETNHDMQIPLEVKQLMEVTDFESQIGNTLNGITHKEERSSLIKILGQKLDQMQLRFNFDKMDSIRKLAFLNARIHLYSYVFFDIEDKYDYTEYDEDSSDDEFYNNYNNDSPANNNTNSSDNSNMKKKSRLIADPLPMSIKYGLIKLFNACVGLINFCLTAQTENKGFMKYLPGVYVISIWQAAFMITKISFSPLKTIIDFPKGKNMFQAAIYLTLRNSVIKYDMSHRFSGIMQSLWQLFDALYLKKSLKLQVKIKSRMAASVFFDCLLVLREQSGMMKFMTKKNPTSSQAQGNDEDANSDVEGVDNIKKSETKSDGVDTEKDNLADSDEYEDNNYPDSDNSASLDEKIKDIGTNSENASGSNSTNENQSSGSRKSHHTLEDNQLRPENSARKIINTIPLDPVPLKHAVSNQSSPAESTISSKRFASPPPPPIPIHPGSQVSHINLYGGASIHQQRQHSAPPLSESSPSFFGVSPHSPASPGIHSNLGNTNSTNPATQRTNRYNTIHALVNAANVLNSNNGILHNERKQNVADGLSELKHSNQDTKNGAKYSSLHTKRISDTTLSAQVKNKPQNLQDDVHSTSAKPRARKSKQDTSATNKKSAKKPKKSLKRTKTTNGGLGIYPKNQLVSTNNESTNNKISQSDSNGASSLYNGGRANTYTSDLNGGLLNSNGDITTDKIADLLGNQAGQFDLFNNGDLNVLLKDISSVMDGFGFYDAYNDNNGSLFDSNK